MLERNGMGDALKTGDGAAGQQARQLSDPKMNFGATEPHVKELEEARAEWRRRHPANPDSATSHPRLPDETFPIAARIRSRMKAFPIREATRRLATPEECFCGT
jgi:hypothetical protein